MASSIWAPSSGLGKFDIPNILALKDWVWFLRPVWSQKNLYKGAKKTVSTRLNFKGGPNLPNTKSQIWTFYI